jgi:Icc-related predicted phosphoesterase
MKDSVVLAAMGDLHYTTGSNALLRTTFVQISENADVLLMCGDFTDHGLPEEAVVLVNDLKKSVRIPIVAVLGNHEYESGNEEEVKHILGQAGVFVLDGTVCEIHGIGFAGAKGFAGGFGRQALQPWGEKAIKDFVQEAVNEATKLESALARLWTDRKIAVLHYSPIQETVEGEHPETFPFLGSSRLEDPLNRHKVLAVFHGHAHRGTPLGFTKNGTPVYNVAKALLEKAFPNHPPFKIVEIDVAYPESTS